MVTGACAVCGAITYGSVSNADRDSIVHDWTALRGTCDVGAILSIVESGCCAWADDACVLSIEYSCEASELYLADLWLAGELGIAGAGLLCDRPGTCGYCV